MHWKLGWLIGLIACAGEAPDEPWVTVDPPLLDPQVACIGVGVPSVVFADVDPLRTPEGDSFAFTVRNRTAEEQEGCGADLEIVSLSALESSFTAEWTGPRSWVAGESSAITLSFLPTRVGEIYDLLHIRSNDPVEPEVRVRLEGGGIGAVLEASTTELNIGEVYFGCEYTKVIRISNQGNGDLRITAIDAFTASDQEWQAGWVPDETLPLVLPPFDASNEGPKADYSIRYRPLDTVADTLIVTFTSSALTGDRAIEASGNGRSFGVDSDTFEGTGGAPPAALSLSSPAVVGAIELSVNGLRVDRGWSYDAPSGTITFEAVSEPAKGAVIEAFYEVQGPCG